MKRCEGANDKVKYCVLMCGDDSDVEVVKAAAGALAMLTEVIPNHLFPYKSKFKIYYVCSCFIFFIL